MAVRRERVILDLQDNFTPGMARAAAAVALMDRNLGSLNRRVAQTGQTADKTSTSLENLNRQLGQTRASTQGAPDNIDRFRRSMDQAGPSIDRYSGRLALMGKALLTLGPGLIPIGAVGTAAVTGLASQLGFAAIGMGSLVVATRGVGDALKAVNEAALEPTAANLEKARAAMAALGPEARDFVSRFQDLRPVLGDIRDAAARGWFPGLTAALDDFERIGPRVGDIFEAIGSAGGQLVAEGADALAGREWMEFLTFVENEGPRALDQFGRSVGNVIHGLAELWMAFDPLNRDFANWLLQASRDFDDWAAGLEQTQGFEDFIDYVRESGPQVERTLGSIAEATVAIIKAASPLGGPVLAAFETIADTLKLIADSPVGSKIFTMAAAFVVLNKTLAVTAALLARTGLISAGTAGRISGAGRGPGAPPSPAPPGGGPGGGPTPVPIMGRINAAKAGLAQFRTDLAALRAATGAQRRASASLIASQQRVNTTLKQTGTTAVKAGAGVGAFAVATGAAGQSLGLQNTAMLGLVGTMAGPWGVAIGAGIGLVADITAANRRWEESLQQINAALASGDSAQIEAANKALKERLDYLNDLRETSGVGDFISDAFRTKLGFDIPDQADFDELQFSKLDTGGGLDRVAAAMGDISTQAKLAAGEVEDLRQELANVGTVLTRQGQFDAYRSAINSFNEALKENGGTLRGNTDKAIALRDGLRNIAASAVEYSTSLSEADRVAFLKRAIASIREAANRAGGMTQKTREIIRELRILAGIDAHPRVTVSVAGLADLKATKSVIDSIRDKTVRITAIGSNPDARGADGMTVPGQRAPYGDKVLSYLAPGEEVISNRYGQADRHRSLLKAINANRYASGGTVGGSRLPALGFADLPGLNLAAMNLKALNKALGQSTRALDRERSQREAITSRMSDLRASVSGKVTSSLFGETDVWSSGGTVGDVLSTLRGDIAGGRQLQAQIAQLRKKGLDGAALDDLLANADAATITNFAAASTADLRAYETAYRSRASIAASVGGSASSAAYGAELRQQTREMRTVATRVERVERAIKAEGRETRQSTKRGVGSGARNRRRG